MECQKIKKNYMGPLSPYISQTIGNFEILPDAKSSVTKNGENFSVYSFII